MTSVYRFIVEGRVQGVGFRQATRAQAAGLNLRGWVRNREDGAVEGRACGDDVALAALRKWLQSGPLAARVTRLDWQPANSEESTGPDFRIER